MRAILIVEPHAATLSLLAQELQLAGYRVLRATDAPAGLELFLQERPDAVLLATDLARIGELSLGRRLREGPGGDRLAMIAIDKAHLGKALGVNAVLDARADAYLPDPTRPALKEKLRELLGKRTSATHPAVATVLDRPPDAAGVLEPLVLVDRLVSLVRQGGSGILVAQSRDLERRLFLLDGGVVGYDSTLRAETPIRWLHARGRLTAEQAGAALAAIAADGLSPTAALVAAGALAAGASVGEFLREYVRDGAATLCGMREGRFRFHPGREHAAAIPAVPVPALACVIAASRTTLPARVCARVLAPFLGRFPRVGPRFEEQQRDLMLEPSELALVASLDGTRTLRELLPAVRGELRFRYGLLFALHVCGCLEHGEFAAPANAVPRVPVPKKPPLPPEEAARIREAAMHALTGSYFQVLGISIASNTEDVERAYHEVASRFHPEKLAGHELGDLEDLLRQLHDRVDAAYRVLASDERRRAYLEHVIKRMEPATRTTGVVVEAEVQVQKGIEILEADPRAAASSFERAIALSPREAAYYAYLAWARFRGATVGSPRDRARDAMRVIRKGLAARPDDDRLIAILGILEAESGDAVEARRHLSQALRINERNRLARAALRRLNRLPGASA